MIFKGLPEIIANYNKNKNDVPKIEDIKDALNNPELEAIANQPDEPAEDKKLSEPLDKA
jgi:hypothetical protein